MDSGVFMQHQAISAAGYAVKDSAVHGPFNAPDPLPASEEQR